MAPRILLVEDDPEIVKLLEVNLRLHGYDFDTSGDGEEALALAAANSYDLVLLDIELPNLSGLEVCRELRAQDPLLPILIVTARKDEMDRVDGLSLGADDYLCKPFSTAELMARVKAQLRRSQAQDEAMRPQAAAGAITAGELLIDPEMRKVSLRGEAIELTPLQFDLLFYLASSPGRTFSRQQILNDVWETSTDGYENNINAHIVRIRRKIEDDPGKPKYLLTVWGIGYRFAELDEL